MSSPSDLARRVVHFLCVGSRIDGLRFGPNYQLLVSPDDLASQEMKGQVYVNLSDSWVVVPDSLSGSIRQEDLVPYPEEEKLQRLCEIRNRRVERIDVAEETNRLILSLEGGLALVLNGQDPSGITWDVGVAFCAPDEEWDVTSHADESLSVECPDAFRSRRGGRLTSGCS